MTCSAAFCWLVVAAASADALSPHPVVVVLSFDGYRTEFLSWPEARYLKLVLDCHAGPFYLIPAFPTKTHVNHFTLATGLHPQQHGVINDRVFDGDGQASENTYEQYHNGHDDDDDKDGRASEVVPIWIENENQGDGRYSAIMMWPGAEFAFQGKKATYNEDYSKYYPPWRNGQLMDYGERLKKIFEWIEDEQKPANLVMAYFGELAKSIHFSGAFSDATKEHIREVDTIVGEFIEQTFNKEISDKIHLIIIGGHGRSDVKYNGIIKLSNYVDDEKVNYITMGANALVNPHPEDFKNVYDKLKKQANESKSFNVYKQDEIQDRWYLKESPLLKDKIFLVARHHYCFWGNQEFSIWKNKGEDHFQIDTDGYDNEDYYMHTFLIGFGMRFKPGYLGSPFNTIDIHPLLKHLLGLSKPASEVQLNTEMCDAVKNMLH